MPPFLDTNICSWPQPSLITRTGVPLTDPEWKSALFFWPDLEGYRPECLKTDEPTDRYNCISWSLGITDEWIDPPQPRAAFDQLYTSRGFKVSGLSGATIDGYSDRNKKMSHASKRDGDTWSSKQGKDLRMTHPRFKIQGWLYGFIEVSFTPTSSQPPLPSAELNISEASSDITKAKVTNLVKRSAIEFPVLADTFEQNWLAWQKSWDDPDKMKAQSSDEFAQGPAWDSLVSMGTSILPQVVDKLKSDSNIFGCQLYNKLQTDPTKKVDPSNINQYYILNNQAKAIVQLYGDQIARFEELATDWASSQEPNAASSDLHNFAFGTAYNAIREMGKLAIPLIMDQYAQQPDGWWHELLYEIEHGKNSNTRVFDKTALYEFWSDWFQRPIDII